MTVAVMWPAFVINLAANTARMANASAALGAQGIGFERLEGVNGWNLPEDEISKVYDRQRNRRDGKHPLVRPEIGCYLSHIECWRKIAEGQAPGGIIFEDDFSASASLAEVLAQICADSSRDWDVVKLFTFDADPKVVKERQVGRYRLVVPYRVPTCLIGYVLTREAARRLAESSAPFFRPVDEDMKFYWEKDLRVALVLPAPITVGDQQAATGTIGNERRSSKEGRGLLHHLLYQLRYRAKLAWHRYQDSRR
jgi:glycosyl transferase, family 25